MLPPRASLAFPHREIRAPQFLRGVRMILLPGTRHDVLQRDRMRARCHIPLEDLPSGGLILAGLEDLAADRITPASLLIRIGRSRLQAAGILENMPPFIPLDKEPAMLLKEMLAGTGQLDSEAALLTGLREFLRAAEARHAAWLRETARLPVMAATLERIEAHYSPASQRVAAFVAEILHDQLRLQFSAILPDSRFAEDLDMTGLEFAEVILALEETLQLKLPHHDRGGLLTVRDLVHCICRRLGERAAGHLAEAA